MPRIDIEDIVEQRLEIIQTETPGLATKYDIEESEDGEYGLISVIDEDSGILCFEFIESNESLMRSGVIDQYNDAAEEGGRVAVIVPESAYSIAAEILSREANPLIELISYGVIGIYIAS